ncbi:MAG: family 1 glycosylhydrolase [Rectinema subterraneum]|jgi:beta-glucosidase
MSSVDFRWCAGIEDTFIIAPHNVTGKTLEEYELTGHYQNWEKDLSNVASLGLQWLRWGIPWYRVNPDKGIFDWSWLDEVFNFFQSTQLSPIVDFVHYGTPAWLEGSFVNPDYPEYVAEYIERVFERYGSIIKAATPCNEPFTVAEWSSRIDDWPPAIPGDSGFIAVMIGIAKGVAKASRIFQSYGVESIHVEVAGGAIPETPDVEELAAFENARQLLYWDLLSGKVNEFHILFPWLIQNGVTEKIIHEISEAQACIDVIGINYYPQWSYKKYSHSANGTLNVQNYLGGTDELFELMRFMSSRYGRPLMITETSWMGSQEEKATWLKQSIKATGQARAEGIEVIGYTWFPVIEMVDWRYRFTPGPIDDFRLDLGLWNIERKENCAAKLYRDIIKKFGGKGPINEEFAL